MNAKKSKLNFIKAIALLIGMVSVMPMSLQGQQQKFPAWMDEVDFSSSSSSERAGFNEPRAPIDPSTGAPVPEKDKKNSPFGKPKLPDFKKMREKAMKAEIEQKAKESNILEQSFNASLKNKDALLATKSQLESLLAANPQQSQKNTLMQALGETESKIKLIAELSKLLESGDDEAVRSTIASLTPENFKKAMEIRQQLFPGKPAGASDIRQPASLFAEQDAQNNSKKHIPIDEDLTPQKKYRPGQIKSFYLESRKARKKLEEEAADE